MKRRGERGFAMLLVFVMAASVAIMLYMELPRVAFEAQRQKEEMLIERGEEYKRAIQIYFRKTKQYPPTMEALENTNGVRFLRRRHIDPITGKSEWRIIHIGPGGVFTDSLVNKPPSAEGEKAKSVNTFTYEAPAIGQAGQGTGPPQGFPAMRASEQRMAQSIAQGQQFQPQVPVDPNNPAPPPPTPGLSTQAAYQAYLQQLPAEQRQNASQADFQAFLQKLQQQQPGQSGVPGQPPGTAPQTQPGASSFIGGSTFIGAAPPAGSQPSPYSTAPGSQGAPSPFGQPGIQAATGAPGQNPALDIIRNQLFNPRPTAGVAAAQAGGMQIIGGIAGVASTAERSGIKVYNERDKYNEWEFLYDLTKDKSGGTPTQGVSGAPGGNPQQPGPPPGSPPFGGGRR